MKFQPTQLRRSMSGYFTVILVVSVAAVAIALLFVALKATLRTRDIQKGSQVRVDAGQRESAILRSILAIAPNKAIIAMKGSSSLAPTPCEWQTLFSEAITLANASDSDGSENTAAGLGGTGVRMGNAANFSTTATDVFRGAGGSGVIYAGVNQRPSASYPPYLTATSGIATLDATYPIVTTGKTYGATDTYGAQLSVTSYPVYNRIPYPNIRFGYGSAGGTFVAKRNWWGFSIRYPSTVPGVPALRKHYVLSLYEVPSQTALSSSTLMNYGRHADNTSWTGVQIQGSVFGERIQADASQAANRISSRTGITLGTSLSVGGTTVGSNFQSDTSIESHEANNGTFYPVSVAAGTGRVAFIPLDRSLDFYRFVGSDVQPDTNTLSPTTWNDYSIGARQCAIKVRVTRMSAMDTQVPTEIVVTYKTSGGEASVTMNRTNGTWSSADTTLPFQTETTETGRNCLTVYISRLSAWLAARGASGLAINHSIAINPDPTGTNIRTPSFPSNSLDMAVVLREGANLTAFTKGFSVVANTRLFFADDLNTTSTTVPAGSGLSGTYFPPMSIFAPEKRWGTSATARSITFTGQMGALGSGTGNATRPLDLRSGSSGGTDPLASSVDAVLSEITSPAQLPPVNFMNWMLTIEEVDVTTGGVASN